MGIFGSYIKILGEKAEKDIEENVFALLLKGEDITYLDCGCDDGAKTINRAKIIGTKKVFGIESEPERAKPAKNNGVQTYIADLNKRWPLEKDSIDCVTATEVIEHLVDLDNFFSEARRVLRTRGTIIISTENLAAYHNIFALILGNQPYTGPYLSRIYPIGHRPHAKYYKASLSMEPHINVMTAKAAMELLVAHGFKILHIAGVGFYPFPPPFSKIFANIDKYHASYIVISAQK